MKNNKKGFTLIELIIVMAILVILMTGVFALFKPVGNFHVNTADTDKRFTAVNGMNDYIEESLKYAKSVYVFSGFSNTNGINLIKSDGTDEKIHERILRTSGLDPTNNLNLKKINVLAIYNKNSSGVKGDTWSDGETYTGRIYKVRGITSKSDYLIGEYQALGPGYYGKYHYEFATEGMVLSNDNTMKLTESSNSNLILNTKIYDKDGNANKLVNAETTSQIHFLNKGKSGAGEFLFVDKSAMDPAVATGGNAGDNIYIFYINQ